MATVNLPQNLLLNLTPQDATRLVLTPSITAHNPLQDNFNLYEVVEAKNKVKMVHLEEDADFLQAKSNCNTWNPNVSFQSNPHEFTLTDYEVNGEQCTDEFDKGVARLVLDSGQRSLIFGNTPELNAVEQAMIIMIQRGLTNNLFQNVWFSDPAFNTVSDNWGTADLGHLSPEQRAKLTTTLGLQNGLWDEIVDYVTADQVAYVDTNDGTSGGNMLTPANVTTLFEEMLLQADLTLRQWGNSITDQSQKPMFLVQPGLFRAYKRYLQSLGQEPAYQLLINGTAVPNVLMWDGYMVVAMPEWDMFDHKTGRMHATTRRSRHQRAILTVPRNFTIGVNMENVSGFPGSGLLVQQSTDIIYKGKKWMYYSFGMGASFAHEKLLVAAYNSDITTFA